MLVLVSCRALVFYLCEVRYRRRGPLQTGSKVWRRRSQQVEPPPARRGNPALRRSAVLHFRQADVPTGDAHARLAGETSSRGGGTSSPSGQDAGLDVSVAGGVDQAGRRRALRSGVEQHAPVVNQVLRHSIPAPTQVHIRLLRPRPTSGAGPAWAALLVTGAGAPLRHALALGRPCAPLCHTPPGDGAALGLVVNARRRCPATRSAGPNL